jgi:hypothetical protein
MAKAQRINVESKPTKDVRDVQLTLSVEEAETLRLVVRLVAGNRENTPRKHTDAIDSALRDAGVSVSAVMATGSIGFGA